MLQNQQCTFHAEDPNSSENKVSKQQSEPKPYPAQQSPVSKNCTKVHCPSALAKRACKAILLPFKEKAWTPASAVDTARWPRNGGNASAVEWIMEVKEPAQAAKEHRYVPTTKEAHKYIRACLSLWGSLIKHSPAA